MLKKILIVLCGVAIVSGIAIALTIMLLAKNIDGDRDEEETRVSRSISEATPDIAAEEAKPEISVEYVDSPDEENAEEDSEDEVDMAGEFFGFLEQIRDLETPMNRNGIEAFKRVFDNLTEEEKLENVSHAVNLIGDENIACLEEILFDLNEPQEVMETIYHDILNRDETVKDRILKKLAQESDHPLREDAAELLD